MSTHTQAFVLQPLALFAVNSLQLTLNEAIAAKDKLSINRFYTMNPNWRTTSPGDTLFAYTNIGQLFSSSALTVKRFLKLDNSQIAFITQENVFQCIMKDLMPAMTVESALFFLELKNQYNESGWYGVSLLMNSKGY